MSVSVQECYWETYVNWLKQVHKQILSDRNAAFTSRFRRDSSWKLDCKTSFTSSYHPQTNGRVEWANNTVVTRLKCEVPSHNLMHRTPDFKLPIS